MIFDAFSMAIKSIIGNKMRSGLTMLGVVIGIASVIILVAIGEAAKEYVVQQVQSFGMKETFMQINPGKDSGDYTAMLNSKLRYKHALLIKEKCPSVLETCPILPGTGKAKYWNKSYNVRQIWGITESYQKIYTHKVVSGRFLNKGDVDGSRKVVVLGKKILDELFGSFNPIGEKIKISGRKFTVIGVFEKKGKVIGQDMDDVVAIPITAAMSLFDSKSLVEIDVVAKDKDHIKSAIDEINTVLGNQIPKEYWHIETAEGMMNLINGIISMLTAVIGGIAAISLIVGSIGIMNIMLVSVTERTKEIGIRKAVGARKFDIFVQFLVESVVISFLGGVLGILLGLSGTFVLMKIFNLGMVVVVWALTLACSVSIIIGIVSGVYPAMRAVNLDPIDALRYE